jgi:hypothetical protein
VYRNSANRENFAAVHHAGYLHRPSAVRVVEISDPTGVGETIAVIEQDAAQLNPRPFSGPTCHR